MINVKNVEQNLTRQKEHLRQERSILERSNFAFLIKLEFAFQTRTDLYMVMEYACGGELLFHLQRANGFDEERAAFYTRIGSFSKVASILLLISRVLRRILIEFDKRKHRTGPEV